MKIVTRFLFAVCAAFLFFSSLSCYASQVTKSDLGDVLPAANVFMRKEEPFGHFLGYSTDGGHFVGVAFLTTEVVPEETWGYRDQIVTLVGVDEKGRITGVRILEENETPRYTRGLLNDDGWFLVQFEGKDAQDTFLLGSDVDTITGATISSSSITRAIKSGLDIVTKEILYQEVNHSVPRHFLLQHLLWQIDFLFLWVIGAIAVIAFFNRNRPLRYLVLGLSIVYIGFLKGGGFSIADVFNLCSFNLPVFLNNLYWYSLLVMAIGFAIIAGRFYCGWLCPFGAVTEVLHKLVPFKYRVVRQADRYLKYVKYVLLGLLLFIYCIGANKNLAGYITSIVEPFATFFKLYGGVLLWGWLISILLISSVISRFYCRYICPLGAFFALLSAVSASLGVRKLNVSLPQENCKGCRTAEEICQMDAIFYNRSLKRPVIDKKECFMCNTCREVCPVESMAGIRKSPGDVS